MSCVKNVTVTIRGFTTPHFTFISPPTTKYSLWPESSPCVVPFTPPPPPENCRGCTPCCGPTEKIKATFTNGTGTAACLEDEDFILLTWDGVRYIGGVIGPGSCGNNCGEFRLILYCTSPTQWFFAVQVFDNNYNSCFSGSTAISNFNCFTFAFSTIVAINATCGNCIIQGDITISTAVYP